MENKWLFFSAHAYPILMICAYLLNMPYTFLGIFFSAYLLFTILDFFVKRDPSVSYDELLTIPENDGRLSPLIYQIETCSYMVLHLIAFLTGLYFVQFKQPFIGWFLYVIPMAFSTVIVLT